MSAHTCILHAILILRSYEDSLVLKVPLLPKLYMLFYDNQEVQVLGVFSSFQVLVETNIISNMWGALTSMRSPGLKANHAVRTDTGTCVPSPTQVCPRLTQVSS